MVPATGSDSESGGRMTRLLIEEVDKCEDCPNYDNIFCYCYLMKVFEDCPLPKIKNSNKRLVMQEISDCFHCCYMERKMITTTHITWVCTCTKHKDQGDQTTGQEIHELIIPDWCSLPKVEPE